MGTDQEGKTSVDAIRNIQLKVPSDLYRRFKLVCAAKDTNMRAMLLRIMETFVEHAEKEDREMRYRMGNIDIRDWMQDEYLAEKIFAGAVKKAIASTHALGLPTAHGDIHGLYYLYPDGHKEYVSKEEAEEILKGKTRYNTDPEILKALGRERPDGDPEETPKGPSNER